MKFHNEHGSAWTRIQNDSGEPKRKLHSVDAEDVANDVVAKLPTILRMVIVKTIEKHHRNGGRFNNDGGGQAAANNLAGQMQAIINAAGALDYTGLNSSDLAKYNKLSNQLGQMGYSYDPADGGDGIAAMAGNTGKSANNSNNLLSALESLF